MRRADRLFQIVQLLSHRRVTTAAQLAERLEVSERTIYRDIQDLGRSGVPVEGEAGVGYRLSKDFELPPLMFNPLEIQALVLGARMVEGWADEELRLAARSALDKVEGVLPEERRAWLRDTALFALSFRTSDIERKRLGLLRHAVEERTRVRLRYRDAKDAMTERTIRPLGLFFWGGTWTVGAWCELREDFRNFRIDRIDTALGLEDVFALESPVTLEDYWAAMKDRNP